MGKFIGVSLLTIGIISTVTLIYQLSPYRQTNRIFSVYSVLSSSWEGYKKQFLTPDGRIIDYTQNSVTTSEGQSYAMLRSVWIDDKNTFDLVWGFTKKNMQRSSDNLFGWRWGERSDNTFGFIENGGENSASDADSDIAFALIQASNRWDDKNYMEDAKKIISDIWKIEVATSSGKNYLTAGNWAREGDYLIINPSYFAPYEWRLFSKVDKNDWNSLIDPAYGLLLKSGEDPLDQESGVGLPPDWLSLDKKTGKLSAVNIPNLTTNYSFDATRTVFRVSLDFELSKDPKPFNYLKSSFKYLSQYYKKNKKLVSSFSHSGDPLNQSESPTVYATSLGYFMNMDKKLAASIYKDKVISLYSNRENNFLAGIPYYDQNWLWFGIALYNQRLKIY